MSRFFQMLRARVGDSYKYARVVVSDLRDSYKAKLTSALKLRRA